MTTKNESQEKFKMIVKSSIEASKAEHNMKISKVNVDNLTQAIFKNIKNYIDEIYG